MTLSAWLRCCSVAWLPTFMRILLLLSILLHSSEALHPRNAFQGSYDMARLVSACPALAPHIIPASASKGGKDTINFSDSSAVKDLNRAILAADYGIAEWDIPEGKLCPPIPGRADYIHHMGDVLAFSAGSGTVPRGSSVRGMDIGTGASLIYPLIGASAYGWSFIATECDEESAGSAARILKDNMSNGQGTVPLSGIEIRRQGDPGSILSGGVLREAEDVDFTMCNPPFYESERAFREANARKIDKLAANVRKRVGPGKASSSSDGRVESRGKKSALSGSNNFGGGASELWCPGGEVSFVQMLAQESAAYSQQCLWFSSLVSQAANLPRIRGFVDRVEGVKVTRVIKMGQGSKTSSVLLWTYRGRREHRDWAEMRGWFNGV